METFLYFYIICIFCGIFAYFKSYEEIVEGMVEEKGHDENSARIVTNIIFSIVIFFPIINSIFLLGFLIRFFKKL